MIEYDLVDKYFKNREEDLLLDVQLDINALKTRVKGINRQEISKLISQLIKEDSKSKEKLLDSIDNLIADYNILIAYYNKKFYKQGFKDAIEIKLMYDNE